MDYQDIRVEIIERVAVVTLHKPESGNTVSDARTLQELEHAIASAQAADAAVLILTGSGKIFSAGGNVNAMREKSGMFAGQPPEVYQNYRQAVQRLTRLMAGLDLVTLAAVNGAAIGAGCDLALMCDMRIAAKKARFGQGFINLGLIPGDGGAWFLARSVPRHVAADLIFTGRVIGADEALTLGLVNQVVEDEQLMERAREIAAVIASKPALALKLSKRLLNRAYQLALPDFLDLCAAYQAMLHATPEHHAALEAFFANR
jgi:enoyl-CoA hydratase/carnithine racemase